MHAHAMLLVISNPAFLPCLFLLSSPPLHPNQGFRTPEEVATFGSLMQGLADIVVGKYDGSLKVGKGDGKRREGEATTACARVCTRVCRGECGVDRFDSQLLGITRKMLPPIIPALPVFPDSAKCLMRGESEHFAKMRAL